MSEQEYQLKEEPLNLVALEYPARPHKFMFVFSMAVVVISAMLLAIVGTYYFVRDDKWDPLGEYPIQSIQSRDSVSIPATINKTAAVPTAAVPIFYLNDTVTSNAIKCVKAGQDKVTVRGTLSWVSDEPKGSIIKVSEGVTQRGPSCVSYTYTNDIPPSVVSEIGRLSREQGVNHSTWHIAGIETPVKSDGTEGVPRAWLSTSFEVYNMNAPKTETS